MPYFTFLLVFLLLSCQQQKETKTGSIERLDAAINALIDENAQPEIIASGFDWAEGPLWIKDGQMLLFSDVPQNKVYKWTEEKGTELYLTPSGYTGTIKRGGEMGSNGLALDKNGRLVLCQHGNRQVARMDAPVKAPKPAFTTIASHYNAQRFNSPNDLSFDLAGNLYFTDPPYGLEQNMEDSSKELLFQGVYRVAASGQVSLLVDSISRPNGIAVTPDGLHLIVANSDSSKACWYIYDVAADGTLTNGRLFYDATAARKQEPGNPDGLKIDRQGNVFASGPGGIWIFSKNGAVLGKIRIPGNVSNCAFSTDEKTVYITADDNVLRLKMRQ